MRRGRPLAAAGVALLALVAVSGWGGASALASSALPDDPSARALASLLTAETELTASDGAFSDTFGSAVAISGDTAVVGAPRDDHAVNAEWDKGSAYVFERDAGGEGAWGEVAKLTASDAAENDFFGASVAMDGDRLVVGAWNDDGKGAAYVFERDAGAWSEVAKLTASDAAADDGFGDPVAIDGDTVVVGAVLDDHEVNGGDEDEKGSAYVFERDAGGAGAWGEVARLTASDAAAGDCLRRFGGDRRGHGGRGRAAG
jgi:hypothetical protein